LRAGRADLDRAIEHYGDLAPRYDHATRRINTIRRRAMRALHLEPGDVVLDAGCGTGWCLPYLARSVGPEGHVIGFDPSPEMLRIAHERGNDSDARVELHQATAETVRLPAAPDAILFSYTHDLIRSRKALEHLFAQARPGARVAATSTKLYARWLYPLNVYLRVSHRGYITNFEGFEAPWSLLAEYLDDFHVNTAPWTQHYVASGRVRAAYAAKKTP
jgi:demethylmenaquinone methyltransferase/2-methoxy-6-polyprenyl-1,4-benzoquinol methylase